ncbi:hypothetical protein [Moorena sp. SIO4G3]|nr:hypothetical protein [Moorena sp. SIO4G3]
MQQGLGGLPQDQTPDSRLPTPDSRLPNPDSLFPIPDKNHYC